VAAPPLRRISTRSPEVSRLTNYVVLRPFQTLPHRLSRTRTREVSQSKGRTLEQPRPVVLAASRGTASANREPTIFFHGLISARSRPAIRPINEVLIPSFDIFFNCLFKIGLLLKKNPGHDANTEIVILFGHRAG
jgi:hypothetical protein